MKMDKIRFIGGSQDVDLPLAGTDVSGPFVLKSADGLGPPEVNVRIAETTQDFGLYQGKKAANRSVVLLIGLQPDWNTGQRPEELRELLYSMLTPRYNQMLTMQIMMQDQVQAITVGHISRFEAALFSKDPAVQITLNTVLPYLYAPANTVITPTLREDGFSRLFDVDNPGTAPSGFRMAGVLDAATSQLRIEDSDPRGQKMVINGINWNVGDTFLVDTRAGSRGFWRAISGFGFTSILNNMDQTQSTWMQMYGGVNTFRVSTDFQFNQDNKFTYRPAYWGV